VRLFWTLVASLLLPLLSVGNAGAANEPVSGVDVIVRSNADGRVMIETVTDRRGAFVMKEMRPGLYSIEAGAKLPLALLKRSGGWGIALIPGSTRNATPQKHLAKPTSRGMQVDIVVPDGATVSYTVIITD